MQRRLIAGVALGAAVIALIGFIGSYAAVRALAEAKHFGTFALLFPIGLDAGILVLLALDMLLTWLRMPLGLLRQTAWLLTSATIAFNGAAAWPDPIGVGMHAVIPVLFVVVVEAARHAVGIAADISAAKHMESVRLSRWLLDPTRTFLLWRRMKLWELRSYDHVIALEQERLIERARLRKRYGRRWRSKAPVEDVLALRLTGYGRPLAPVVVDAAPVAPLPEVEYDPAWDEGAPFADPMWDGGAPAFTPAPQGAPELPAPPPAAAEQGAPQRPAPQIEGAPERPAPEPEGAPQGDAPVDQGAPQADEGGDQGAPGEDAPEPEGAPERPADEDEAPRDEQRPPTRDEVKRRIRALYDELDARPGEGRIVALLKSLDGYPYTSRRHAQKLRDEIERKEPKLAERGSDNVRALTGT
ncbi:DUF2637 domain-containing protein [Streptomyces griseofuscus]|uniref:DUF2637 domain-containing protein n=1 Tax=Streptomyces griseofuscus TaxID=146922 RepID=UPI001FD19EE2|nr:DUF2637 domain-containing protein [Streptomyces griseofuscus]